jgi:dCTP deaminase
MILSNQAIFAALDEGRLIIDPEPSPRFPSESSAGACPYETSSVDLRLGNEVSWLKENLPVTLAPHRGKIPSLLGPTSNKRTLTNDQPFILEPYKFVLGITLERVALPLRNDGRSLAARVEGKSSYARCGMLVHFTAPTIHAGYDGRIVLEIINLGPCSIELSPGKPICQLIIEEVQGIPIRNDSQFQGQTKSTGER